MSDDDGEKSFAPTEKRKRDAAQKGDVLRSRELGTAAAVLAGAVWMLLAGPWLVGALGEAMRAALRFDRAALDDFTPGPLIADALIGAAVPVMLLGVGVAAVSLVAQLGFGEGRWVGQNLMPKGSRINPLSGFKRMLGPNGLIEIGKAFAKVGLLGTIAWVWARLYVPELSTLGRGDLGGQLARGWYLIVLLVFVLSAGLFLIAAVDLPIQWLRRNKRLKMTLQQMRDEHKEAEGSPENKAAQRDRQRRIATGGLVPVMQEAQFIVTNPTHFAVALGYDPDKAPAPVVLAKGRGDKALAMRDLAAEYTVPVLEYPALARSLYYSTREQQMIREELYVAVASILGFVLSVKRGERRARPEVSVPVTLRFDASGRLEGAGTHAATAERIAP
jgi:flagellar biosynthesis protein FlhB